VVVKRTGGYAEPGYHNNREQNLETKLIFSVPEEDLIAQPCCASGSGGCPGTEEDFEIEGQDPINMARSTALLKKIDICKLPQSGEVRMNSAGR
jgi:hypothetical protein